MIARSEPLFPLGLILATPAAMEMLEAAQISPSRFLHRHASGDWGDLSEEDRRLNDRALRTGERVLSVYRPFDRGTLWIITEADRSATTLLTPEEY